MNTNALLIVIIVLLILGLFFQFLQLAATYSIPERIIDLLVDFVEVDSEKENIIKILDVDNDDQIEQKNNKGFGKSQKSKRSKRGWMSKVSEIPRNTSKGDTEIEDN